MMVIISPISDDCKQLHSAQKIISDCFYGLYFSLWVRRKNRKLKRGVLDRRKQDKISRKCYK